MIWSLKLAISINHDQCEEFVTTGVRPIPRWLRCATTINSLHEIGTISLAHTSRKSAVTSAFPQTSSNTGSRESAIAPRCFFKPFSLFHFSELDGGSRQIVHVSDWLALFAIPSIPTPLIPSANRVTRKYHTHQQAKPHALEPMFDFYGWYIQSAPRPLLGTQQLRTSGRYCHWEVLANFELFHN